MSYYALEDADAIDRLLDDWRAIDAGYVTNAAVNDPKILEQRQSTFLGKLRHDPDAPQPVRPSKEEIQRASAAFLKKMNSAQFMERLKANDSTHTRKV